MPLFSADRLVKTHLRERFIVTTKSDETFDGLLVDADAKTLRLVNATVLVGAEKRATVDGELFIPRHEIKYLQKPDGRV